MRQGVLSDVAIQKANPEYFPVDFRTHQSIYEDSTDIPTHGLRGIKRPKTPHAHLKVKPRVPIYDLFHVAQAATEDVRSNIGFYRRAIGDALEREGTTSMYTPSAAAAFHVAKSPVITSGGRQQYVAQFNREYGDLLQTARVDPRAKVFIELAGLDPFQFIPRTKTASRVHITAGGVRNELLKHADTLSTEELRTIEGAFRLSDQIANQDMRMPSTP